MGGFVSKGPVGWLDNLLPNLGGKKESKGATERETEGRSWWGRLRLWTEVILVQTFF